MVDDAYDNPHSELPATTTDATGSTRQMTWSRYGQLLAFTDCSGYQTRYELPEITMDEELRLKALRPINKMLEMSKQIK